MPVQPKATWIWDLEKKKEISEQFGVGGTEICSLFPGASFHAIVSERWLHVSCLPLAASAPGNQSPAQHRVAGETKSSKSTGGFPSVFHWK